MQAELARFEGDMPMQREGIHSGGSWSELPFIASGLENTTQEAVFPATMSLLRAVGAAANGGVINARLSLLEAGTTISPHCGMSNAKVLTFIFTLIPCQS